MCDFFFFKQKTAYEMRISDWSSDVCSSDLMGAYVMAKSAVAAFSRQLGGAGEAFGIKANAILPMAYSRMNWESLKGTPEGDYLQKFASPDQIAAAASYLLHEECPVSGMSFSVSGGRIARVVYAPPIGSHHPPLTPEQDRKRGAK